MSLGLERIHWPRWIKASVAKHFDENRQGIKLFVEAEDRDIDEDHEGDVFELRIDGPNIKRFGTTWEWFLDFEINLLVSSAMRENDLYHFDKLLGIANVIFVPCIPIYRYGDNKDAFGTTYDPVIDTGTLLGNLQLQQDSSGRDWIETHPFGQIRTDVKLQQATVEAHFRMELNTEEVDNA